MIPNNYFFCRCVFLLRLRELVQEERDWATFLQHDDVQLVIGGVRVDNKLLAVPQVDKEGIFGEEALNFLKGLLHFRSPFEFAPFAGALSKWLHDVGTAWVHFFVEIYHAH